MSLGRDNAAWCRPAGSLASGAWDCVVDDGIEGWQHTGLRTATLGAGERVELDLPGTEAMVLPLSGGDVRAEVKGHGEFLLGSRPSVFAGPADALFVPEGSGLVLTAVDAPARVAVCLARVPEPTLREPRHLPAGEVPVEVRGAGIASRRVRNFGVPGALEADRMIAVEVITPAGNWSSWPPHKHDEDRPGVETDLEEIYYYETQSTDARGSDALGYQRVYGTDERPIDVLAEVRTGDVVLVPHGWHGPAIAAPNADLYYLNVMAGPGSERSWLICDDPAHAWVREGWADQAVDPRVVEGT